MLLLQICSYVPRHNWNF